MVMRTTVENEQTLLDAYEIDTRYALYVEGEDNEILVIESIEIDDEGVE